MVGSKSKLPSPLRQPYASSGERRNLLAKQKIDSVENEFPLNVLTNAMEATDVSGQFGQAEAAEGQVAGNGPQHQCSGSQAHDTP
jgi:hypothetical protein